LLLLNGRSVAAKYFQRSNNKSHNRRSPKRNHIMDLIDAKEFGNAAWEVKEGQVRLYRAPRAVVVVGSLAARFQILDVMFSKDGSLMVLFPHLDLAPGIVSHAKIPAVPPFTVHLEPAGRVTGHVVKYSHHQSGKAHFSLSAKTTSEVGRASIPLSEENVLIFRVHVYFPNGFAEWKADKQAKDRVYFPTLFNPNLPTAITIQASWRRKQFLVDRLDRKEGELGPIAKVFDKTENRLSQLFLLGQPQDSPYPDHVLAIEVVETKPLAAISSPSLIFIGGLDAPAPDAKPGDPSDACLIAWYPLNNAVEKAAQIGTIDTKPGALPLTPG
jgi:hypothetical protein